MSNLGLFQERLSKTKSADERERMIARRKKFQSSGPVQASESKVISLKSKRKQASPSAHVRKQFDIHSYFLRDVLNVISSLGEVVVTMMSFFSPRRK